MERYSVDPDNSVICLAGTCDEVSMLTSISSICQKTLTVMSQEQFVERKQLPKREYQKEVSLIPSWMYTSNAPDQLPFYQNGDVGFCEVAFDAEGKGLMKHNAIRSNSSNPRVYFLNKIFC